MHEILDFISYFGGLICGLLAICGIIMVCYLIVTTPSRTKLRGELRGWVDEYFEDDK